MSVKQAFDGKPMVVGVDDGHDGIKIYAGINAATNEPIQLRIPARARSGQANIGDDEKVAEERISVNGNIFTVSGTLPQFADTRTENYPTSELNAALVYQALRLACLPSNTLKVTTGLPVNRFYGGTNRSLNHALLKAKVDNLKERTDIYNLLDESKGTPRIQIIKHTVLCEAQAAFYDYILDDHGNIVGDGNEYIEFGAAVLDIGGRTTDCIMVNPGGQTLDSERSNTIDIGVLSLRERIIADIKATHSISTISESILEKAIQTGVYGFGSKQIDVLDIIENAKVNLVDELAPFIDRNIRNGEGLRGVIVVGGGSEMLKKQLLDKYSADDFNFPDQPVFANARGFYKAAKHIINV